MAVASASASAPRLPVALASNPAARSPPAFLPLPLRPRVAGLVVTGRRRFHAEATTRTRREKEEQEIEVAAVEESFPARGTGADERRYRRRRRPAGSHRHRYHAGGFNGGQGVDAREGAEEHQVGAALHAGEVRSARGGEQLNKRLRDGYDYGAAPEEDDLVRLQLEALLAEKSRLSQDNANLTRENQSLIQLVEYLQLTSQDLAASYEDVMEGMRLDFLSPLGKIDSDDDEGEGEFYDGVPVTPG